MSCEILTADMLETALRRRMTPQQRAVLLRHLREPCDGCLDLLADVPADEILAAAAVAPPTVVPIRRRRPVAWAAAAAAVVLIGVATMRQAEVSGVRGLKGEPALGATLVPFVGARTPTPHMMRALAPGGRFAPGEVLLLRIHLDAPAWVYLLSQRDGAASEVIWPTDGPSRHDAGEFELAQSGSALAVDPAMIGNGGRVLLIASARALDARQLRIGEQLRSRDDLQRIFPGCGVDLLPILVEVR